MRSELTTPKSPQPWWRTGAALRFGALALLVATLFAVMIAVGPDRASLSHAVSPDHPFAPVLAVFGTALLTTALLPRTLLSAVGGLLFGFSSGALYILAGVTLGAILAHTVGRYLGREFMARYLRGRLLLIEQAVAKRGILAVVISRMIPLVPFGVSNYLFGTTRVRLLPFIGGTILGAMPATLAYAALGSATARGDAAGMSIAGVVILTLGIGGSIGSLLVWRRRPRKHHVAKTAPISPAAPATA
ncbi:VTT domain-containing protein [Dactylosporangium sp. AC04546]|uniref:TVP38/TMEM64 family protein n=1 Tax=Dactylosporangium sp. AC04546 TaxID=2862460 RepID=UPI001EDF8E36|nr:VTT domain-containing protein [Dactylosporangium sp. AC04546]WVK84127.1 VTT domain-containing protein [Dactylosporangium sp. AC04546]